MTLLAPNALYRPVANTAHDAMQGMRGLVLHVQQGDNSPFARFNDPSTQVSSTWWVSKTGALEQYVDNPRVRMWAQAAGNEEWCSVETEGFDSEPLTGAQINTLARLYAWGHTELGWQLQTADSPSGFGFGTHVMGGAAWGGHPCPGTIRSGQRAAILNECRALIGHNLKPGQVWVPPQLIDGKHYGGAYDVHNVPSNAKGVTNAQGAAMCWGAHGWAVCGG